MKKLFQAIKDQNPKKVEEILAVRPNSKFNFDHEGETKGLIPLHYLAGADIGPRKAGEIFNLLLAQPDHAADQRAEAKSEYQRYIDTTTRDGKANTALHIATQAKNSNAVLTLLRAGASTHIKNAEGKTPVELTNDEALQLWFKQYSHDAIRAQSLSPASTVHSASPIPMSRLCEITEMDRRIFSLAGITFDPQVQEISEDIKVKVRNAEFNGRPLIQEAIDKDDPYMVERLITFYRVKTDIKVRDGFRMLNLVSYVNTKKMANAGKKLLELKVNQEEYPAILISCFQHNRKELALKFFDIVFGNIPSTQEKIISFQDNDVTYVVTGCRDDFNRENIDLKTFVKKVPLRSQLSNSPSSSASAPARPPITASASSSSASTSVPRSMTNRASSSSASTSVPRSMTNRASSSSASTSVPRSMTNSASPSSASISVPRSMTNKASSSSVSATPFMLPYTSNFATSLQIPTYLNVPPMSAQRSMSGNPYSTFSSTPAPRPVTDSGYPTLPPMSASRSVMGSGHSTFPPAPTAPSVLPSTSSSSASASAPYSEEVGNDFNHERAGTDYLYFSMSKEFIRLKKAVIHGKTETVKKYIQVKKLDVNFDYPYDDDNKNNKKTFLRFAMEAQNLEMIKLLISLGAIVYQTDIDAAHSQKEMKDILQEAFDKTTPLERFLAKHVGLNVYNTPFNENVIKSFREHSKNGASLLHLIATDNRFPKEEIEPILRKFMEKYKPDINIKNNQGETPLHLLSKSTKLTDKGERNKRVLCLITLGADINTINKAGETPIFSAARNGNYPLVTMLCEFGANTNIKNKKGQFLIDVARHAKCGEKTLNCLKNVQAPPSSSDSYTVTGGNLFFSGNPVNLLPKGLRRVFRDTNAIQHEELSRAVEQGDIPTVRKLIVRKQYNVNFLPTDDSSTALFIAIKASHDEMVTLLLGLGALVYEDDLEWARHSQLSAEVKDKLSNAYSDFDTHDSVDGFIVRTMGLNFYEFIKVPFELKKLAIHNFKGQEESSLLHMAVRRGLTDHIAQLVVKYGVDVNLKRGEGGRTPLHLAVMLEYNAKELVERLLVHKADVNIRDDNGKTPIDYAREAGKEEIVACLERGAPIGEPPRKRLRQGT